MCKNIAEVFTQPLKRQNRKNLETRARIVEVSAKASPRRAREGQREGSLWRKYLNVFLSSKKLKVVLPGQMEKTTAHKADSAKLTSTKIT